MAGFLNRLRAQAEVVQVTEGEGDIRRAQRLINYVEEHESRWFWETDAEGKLTYLSTKVASRLEDFRVETIGARLSDVFKLDGDGFERARTLSFHLMSRTAFTDYAVRGVKGLSDSWWSISGRPRLDETGNFQGFTGSGTDLTQIRRHEAEIKRLALFDSLTGLANRQRMLAALKQMLLPKHGDIRQTALMLLDLDSFKMINDTLGHPIGDELLKQVAKRLVQVVGEAGLVGRRGGDEFEVILPQKADRESLSELANAIITAVSQPYVINDSALTVSCSIGLAIAPEHGDDAETLVRNADLALYAAKDAGRATHRFYEEAMLVGAQKRKQLEDDLREALAEGQLRLVYQPIVATQTQMIVGFEALLRWDHPLLGAISPAEFIPVAEDSGLIETIGEWVLRTAAQDARAWPHGVRVAVNVSAIQFANPAFAATVTSALAEAQLAPHRLELEITESVFIADEATSDRKFAALKGIGVRLALDDFGTGYSSLSYLKSAPFDKIKIDQSFVRGAIMSGKRNAAIIQAIVTLANTLDMETTAEGVEHQDEIGFIETLGCSHVQGFVYGPPLDHSTVIEALDKQGGKASVTGHKISRPFRTKMLRSSRLRINDSVAEVRIRNMSATGVMIDNAQLPPEAVGVDVLIELLENELARATVRWTNGDQAGLELHQTLSTEIIEQVSPASTTRSPD